jgi:hypothetical protein
VSETTRKAGIYYNPATQEHQLWAVNDETGEAACIAAVSAALPDEAIRWWSRRAWGRLFDIAARSPRPAEEPTREEERT